MSCFLFYLQEGKSGDSEFGLRGLENAETFGLVVDQLLMVRISNLHLHRKRFPRVIMPEPQIIIRAGL